MVQRILNSPLILCILLCLTITAQTGASEPEITVTDSVIPADDFYIPFGSVAVNNLSEQTVTITNDGTAELLIGDITNPSPPFSKSKHPPSPPVSPGNNYKFTISFSPTTPDSFCDSFDIPSNDPDESAVTVTVSGAGFSSGANNPPSTPLLVHPTNGQTGLGTTVEFRWKKSTDPDGDPVTYDLYYCKNQDFTGCTPVNVASLGKKDIYYAGIGGIWLLFFGIATAGCRKNRKKIPLLLAMLTITIMSLASCGDINIDDGTSGNGRSDEISYTVSGLDSDTPYYWKIIAKSSGKQTDSCVVWSFTT